MGIKVEHQGNAASRIAGMSEGGRAKRAMESAQLVRPSQIQTLTPAHASAPGAGAPSAPTISAPGGGAHAGLVGGGGGVGQVMRGAYGGRYGGGVGSTRAAAPAGPSFDDLYKITGYEATSRPDTESQWDPSRSQWVRKWLPGEKEAEALERTLGVKNSYAINLDTELGINKAALDRNKTVNEIYRDAQFKLNALSGSPKLSEQMQFLKDAAFATARRLSQGYGRGETVTPQSSQDSYYSDLLKNAGEQVQYDPNNMQSVGTDATSDTYWDDDKTVVVRDGNFGW